RVGLRASVRTRRTRARPSRAVVCVAWNSLEPNFRQKTRPSSTASLDWTVQYDPIVTSTSAPEFIEERRSDRKRRAIIDAATAAFLEHGYRGTSMDAVAAAG